jgi:hypothetical protein
MATFRRRETQHRDRRALSNHAPQEHSTASAIGSARRLVIHRAVIDRAHVNRMLTLELQTRDIRVRDRAR